MAKQGDRVFAVESASDSEIRLFGFGTYVGDELPPAPLGMAAMLGSTWDEVIEELRKYGDEDLGDNPRDALPKNPKIVLDDGNVVWGAECWWGPIERYEEFRKGRTEVIVR